MKLIVGLGNPGRAYADSRHNIGFSIVKALAKAYKISLKKESRALCLSGKGKIENQDTLLVLPLTFMNLSGNCISALLKKYKITLDNLLVICDDLDLELGRLKIRPAGSSAGQRGLQSIIKVIRSQEFCRLRIGIGRPNKKIDIFEYVLSPFRKKEKAQVKEITEEAVDCCRTWLTKGINESMNTFNRSP